MTKEEALIKLNQLIGELPFKVVATYNLVEVYNVLKDKSQE